MTWRLADGSEWICGAALALLLALCAATVAGAVQGRVDEVDVQLRPLPGTDGRPARLSADERALLLPGGGARGEHAARLQFTLPPASTAESRWVVWVGRDAVDRVMLQGEGWRSAERDFFAPAGDEGLLPTGFQFPLPSDWSGEKSLDLGAHADLRGALRPRVMRETAAMRLEQRGAVLGAVTYAALFMLTLLMLALYVAARDRIYLRFFGTSALSLLLVAADNGHLYQVPVLQWFAAWRGQGLWALGLLLLASVLQLLQRYAFPTQAHPRLSRSVDGYCIVLALLAAACLLDSAVVGAWIPVAGPALWVVATLLATVLMAAHASHRRERLARSAVLALIVVSAVLLAVESLFPGRWTGTVWFRHAYQLSFVAALAVLAMGLISRIGEFRSQRDQDRLARLDSEKRMRRETARAELNNALQAKLRTLAPGDLEWTAYRLLLDHLLPQVPAELAMTMAYGYQGQDVLVVAPQSRQADADDLVAQRRLQLKRLAANGIAHQQPVAVTRPAGAAAVEALVPFPIRTPAWGMLLLQRSGEDGFSGEEMALASELLRLTLTHVEQALAAINLRRSAELDALTGAFNRRTIDQWMSRCFSDAQRNGQPMAVLFIDMDHFKRVNDQHGHACGDECLRRVAATLRGSLSESDVVGRYGGEEFVAVLPGRNGADAREIAERLRAAVERLQIDWEGETLRLTVSVGMAARVTGEDSAESMVDRADKALYAAKRGGRNCVHAAPARFA